MVRVVWTNSRRQFERRMRKAESRIAKELKKQTRKAGGVIRKNVRRRIRSQFKKGPRPDVRDPGLLARSIQVSIKSKRGARLQISAAVLPSNKKQYFPAKLYAPALERGGTIVRRAARRGSKIKRGAHAARYTGRPFFEPGVRESKTEVFRLIGKTFNAV